MTPDDHNQIWDLVEAGESYASIGKEIGRRLTTWLNDRARYTLGFRTPADELATAC